MEQEQIAPASDSIAPVQNIFDDAFDMAPYEKNIKSARNWLYVIAVLQFIMGIVEYAREADKTVGWVSFGIDALIAVVFLVLALWSRQKPVLAFSLALGLYILLSIGFMILDSATMFRGLIIKAFVVIALVKAYRDARKYEEIRNAVGRNEYNNE